MAITKTQVMQRTEVYPAADSTAEKTTNEGNPTMMVVMTITFDDTKDEYAKFDECFTEKLLNNEDVSECDKYSPD